MGNQQQEEDQVVSTRVGKAPPGGIDLRLHDDILKKMMEMDADESMFACDGRHYYTATRVGKGIKIHIKSDEDE
jgi:hypothetical protein